MCTPNIEQTEWASGYFIRARTSRLGFGLAQWMRARYVHSEHGSTQFETQLGAYVIQTTRGNELTMGNTWGIKQSGNE